MPGKEVYSTEAIAKALMDNRGYVYYAARDLGCAPKTIYRRLEQVKYLREILDDQRGMEIDIVKVKLREAIMRGEGWAIRFYLSTIGKEHGFTEKFDWEIEREKYRAKMEMSEGEEPEDEPLILSATQIAPSFSGVYRDIVNYEHSEYVLKGGRGSTKSSFASEVIIQLLVNNPEWHVLACRQVANTLRDSVYSQLTWAISYLGLESKFKINLSPLEITYRPTGQKIYFRGGDDPMKIKSIKPPFGYINILWFEELDQFHGANTIRNIMQSAIRGGERALVIKSYNPPRTINNWVYKELAIPKPNRYVHESDYTTVPKEWLGQAFIDEALYLKEVNPDAYDHEYLGVANAAGGMVFENVQIRDITDDEIKEYDRIYHGLDFGYYPDPAHYSRCYFKANSRELFIFGEFRGWKMGNRPLYDALVAYGLTESDDMTCDSAEPKSIADLRDYGARARAAIKGADSVEYSIKWLQSLRAIIIDNKRCPHTADEFLSYEYERTKDGEIISGYPDENNHAIDAVRYATNLIWKRRGQ